MEEKKIFIQDKNLNIKYYKKRDKSIGHGAEGDVFLVNIDNNSEETFALKVIKNNNILPFKRETKYLNILKNINNNKKEKNIVNIINFGEGYKFDDNNKKEEIIYIALEYCENKSLIDYICDGQEGFGELYSKFILKKVFNGVKLCHNNKICHRDIKPDNILLDKSFEPKLCDFGHAVEVKNGELLTEKNIGTDTYIAPEISGDSYDGFKLDIFSLGIVLQLVTFAIGLNTSAIKYHQFYDLLIQSNSLIWKELETAIKSKKSDFTNISDEFKELFIQMISEDPQKRPDINAILNHKWFKEIDEMDEQKKAELEQKIKEEFNKRAQKNNEKKFIYQNESENNNVDYRTLSDEYDVYFSDDIEIKIIKEYAYLNYYLKIKANMEPIEFMNKLCTLLDKKFHETCEIETDDYKPYFKIRFTGEKSYKNNILGEIIEKLNLKISDYIEKEFISIKIKLYKIANTFDEYLINFVKKEGNRGDFIEKFYLISDIIREII